MHSCCLLCDTKTDAPSPSRTGKRFPNTQGIGGSKRGRAAFTQMFTRHRREQDKAPPCSGQTSVRSSVI